MRVTTLPPGSRPAARADQLPIDSDLNTEFASMLSSFETSPEQSAMREYEQTREELLQALISVKGPRSEKVNDFETALKQSERALAAIEDFIDAVQTRMQFENPERFERLHDNSTLLEEALFRFLKQFDPETAAHSKRVAEYAVALAEEVGFGEDALQDIRQGALLHDIGKLCVHDQILSKVAPLNPDEWELVKLHPDFGKQIIGRLCGLRTSHALEIAQSHHERVDGSGYPSGLRGSAIPVAAQICAIADVWDALTSERPYKKAWSVEKAEALMRSQAGSHFHPALIKIFFDRVKPELTAAAA